MSRYVNLMLEETRDHKWECPCNMCKDKRMYYAYAYGKVHSMMVEDIKKECNEQQR